MNFKGFISKWGNELAKTCEEKVKPVYNFDAARWTAKMTTLLRRPKRIQAHAIAACCERLEKNRDIILVGEAGIGKTLISISTAAVASTAGYQNILVLCPPYLVDKWEREINNTIDNTRVTQIESITDLERAVEKAKLYGGRRFFILSKETAKLSSGWEWAITMKRQDSLFSEEWATVYRYFCPSCGKELLDMEGKPYKAEDLPTARVKHSDISNTECKAALWQYVRSETGNARYPLARYIKKYHSGFFDLLISDEVHEFRGATTAQGTAYGQLSLACKKVMSLTGTLFGGYSSTLFYLLYRTSPEIRKKFPFGNANEWVKQFGYMETCFKTDMAGKKTHLVRELPGIMPDVINYIVDKTVFVTLADLDDALPPFNEVAMPVEMSHIQSEMYLNLESGISRKYFAISRNSGKGSNKLGILRYLQALLTYPDLPGHAATVYDLEGKPIELKNGLDPQKVYPKEEALINLVLKEKAAGRKVLVFCSHTKRLNVAGRVVEALTRSGLKVAFMDNTVKARKREAWIMAQVKDGIDALVCNPKLVETGLDLLSFPSIVFYEPVFSLYTMRQSSRRSWRIGQLEPVYVYYMYYRGCAQEDASSLIARKLRAAIMLDGDVIDPQGLASLDIEQDITAKLVDCISRNVRLQYAAQEIDKMVQNTGEAKDFVGQYNDIFKTPVVIPFLKKPAPPIVVPHPVWMTKLSGSDKLSIKGIRKLAKKVADIENPSSWIGLPGLDSEILRIGQVVPQSNAVKPALKKNIEKDESILYGQSR